MSSRQKIGLIYAKTINDLTEYLNGTPDATGVRVEMGPRFWGCPSIVQTGIPDPDLEDDRVELMEAIADHPSLEVLVFRGSSWATFEDLAMILRGTLGHATFRSVMVPVVPPENYTNPTIRSRQLRGFTQLIYKSSSLTNVRITNGTNNPGDYPDGYGEHLETKMTQSIQKAVKSLLRIKSLSRQDRESKV